MRLANEKAGEGRVGVGMIGAEHTDEEREEVEETVAEVLPRMSSI